VRPDSPRPGRLEPGSTAMLAISTAASEGSFLLIEFAISFSAHSITVSLVQVLGTSADKYMEGGVYGHLGGKNPIGKLLYLGFLCRIQNRLELVNEKKCNSFY
jgi:hypothetical protein